MVNATSIKALRMHYAGEERNVTVWRPSVCPSVCPVGILTVTHQGQHATRPAYISARQ